MEAGIKAQDVEEKLEDLQDQGATVGLKLQQLRNKILKARQAATNVSSGMADEALRQFVIPGFDDGSGRISTFSF